MKRIDFKKQTSNIFYVLYLLLFGSTTIISILSLIGFGFAKTIIDTISFPGLFIIFSSVGVIIILDNILFKTDDSKKLQNILTNVENLSTENGSIRILKNESEHYLLFKEAIFDLKEGSEICVTAFEKYNYTDYDAGSSDEVNNFMKYWNEKIVKDKLSIKHIVHISDKYDLLQLEKRIASIKDADYSISVICGLPIIPYLDFVVIKDKSLVMFSIPTEKSHIYENAFSVAIQSPEITENFLKYFYTYFNADFSKVVHSRNTSEEYKKNLNSLSSFLPKEYPKSDLWEINKYLLKCLKSKVVFNTFQNMVDDLERLHTNDLSGYFIGKIINFSNHINEILEQKIEISYNEGLGILQKIFTYESVKIKAISDETNPKDDFWNSKFGKAFLDNNYKTVTEGNGKISRIFIVNENDIDRIKKIIKIQKRGGIEANYILSADLQNKNEDFLIVNDSFLLILNSDKAIISMNKDTIHSYIRKFDILLSTCNN